MKELRILSILFFCVLPLAAVGALKLPGVFGDGMVLQANRPIHVWGWAAANEKIAVGLSSEQHEVQADGNGFWEAELSPMQYGGPYNLTVCGESDSIRIKDILIGEVWLCSGQSNMEFPTRLVDSADWECENAGYPQIRLFSMPKKMSFSALPDCEGQWKVCSPTEVADFSAVAYFYGRELHEKLNVPIGLIDASWGGTCVETWIGGHSYSELPMALKLRHRNVLSTDTESFFSENERSKRLYEEAFRRHISQTDGGVSDLLSLNWRAVPMPSVWSQTGMENMDGIAWYRCSFEIDDELVGKAGRVSLGAIDDSDVTWLNSVEIGRTDNYAAKRMYHVPEGVLEKQNELYIRVVDTAGEGGTCGVDEEFFIQIGNEKLKLADEKWELAVAVDTQSYNYIPYSPNSFPSLLYNAMISPILPFEIKGVIWYQGESNADYAYDYRHLFPALIRDWRKAWGYEFPFYWVQLANFMQKDKEPEDSGWAVLRESQNLALSEPQTGQAVITDIGEADDIHPKNKQDVGLRLARIALRNAYGKDSVVCSGPTFERMEVAGNEVVVTFGNVARGLRTANKYGYVSGFAISGKNRVFKWAKARIEGNRIVLSSEGVENPIAVRYCWSDNPDVDLYNSEGLPAVPFRTDTWPVVSESQDGSN